MSDLPDPAQEKRDLKQALEKARSEIRRLRRSMQGVRRLVYGTRSPYKKGADREGSHHYDAAVCPKIITRQGGEHPSACSYRVESIEAVAEIVETALSEKYSVDVPETAPNET